MEGLVCIGYGRMLYFFFFRVNTSGNLEVLFYAAYLGRCCVQVLTFSQCRVA